jgi:hypothetical protein
MSAYEAGMKGDWQHQEIGAQALVFALPCAVHCRVSFGGDILEAFRAAFGLRTIYHTTAIAEVPQS